MSAAALLNELEDAGVHLSAAGDDLRFKTRPGVRITPYAGRIREHKPALLTILALQDEIVRTASVARDVFDRWHYDELWVAWHALQQESLECRQS